MTSSRYQDPQLAEAEEFVGDCTTAPFRRPLAEPVFGGDETGKRRPQRGGAFGRSARANFVHELAGG
jgi:hypothetical protein